LRDLLCCHEFVHIPVRSTEVLPGRAGLAHEIDAGCAQLRYRSREITYRKAGDRAGIEVLLASIACVENHDVVPVGSVNTQNPGSACVSRRPSTRE
jgi:hypothetical protein